MAHKAEKAFIPLDIAVLTVSDTRHRRERHLR